MVFGYTAFKQILHEKAFKSFCFISFLLFFWCVQSFLSLLCVGVVILRGCPCGVVSVVVVCTNMDVLFVVWSRRQLL